MDLASKFKGLVADQVKKCDVFPVLILVLYRTLQSNENKSQ